MSLELQDFIEQHMRKGGRFVAARLQAALALIEKLRDMPSLRLEEHLASRGSAGLESHETYGNRAHQRLNLVPLNKNHGRRSSSLQDWGQTLLDRLGVAGFGEGSPEDRESLIEAAQAHFGAALKAILLQEPLEVKLRGRSAEAVIHDVLKQAEEKGKSGEGAQYLVGAKLTLRFDQGIPIQGANRGDRRRPFDPEPRTGDFQIGNATFEVAVGLPDDKHIQQIMNVLDVPDAEVWLLTRADRVVTWKNELDRCEGLDTRRVVVTAVESFVGQNVAELGNFSARDRIAQLRALFDLYNTWIDRLGPPGLRIVAR